MTRFLNSLMVLLKCFADLLSLSNNAYYITELARKKI